jgi:hypothetical protein
MIFFQGCFITGLKDETDARVLMAWPQIGWKILEEIRKKNNLSLIKLENHPLFLSLNQSLPLFLPLY